MKRFLYLTTIATLGISLSACGWLFAQDKGGSDAKKSSGPWTGPIAFTNASSTKVCGLQFRNDSAALAVEVEPGASVELPPHPKPDNAVGFWAINCAGNGVVSGTLSMVKPDFADGVLKHGRITLYDAGATPKSDEHAVFVAPESFEEGYRKLATHMHKQWSPGTMAKLAPESLTALRAYAEMKRYTEKYLSLELIFSEWELNRHRQTGAMLYRWMGGLAMAQFPSGKCMLYPVSFQQAAAGDGFDSKLTSNGAGGGMGVPCAMAAWQATRKDVVR